MTSEDIKKLTKEEISHRIREGVKAVIEQVFEEENKWALHCCLSGTDYSSV